MHPMQSPSVTARPTTMAMTTAPKMVSKSIGVLLSADRRSERAHVPEPITFAPVQGRPRREPMHFCVPRTLTVRPRFLNARSVSRSEKEVGRSAWFDNACGTPRRRSPWCWVRGCHTPFLPQTPIGIGSSGRRRCDVQRLDLRRGRLQSACFGADIGSYVRSEWGIRQRWASLARSLWARVARLRAGDDGAGRRCVEGSRCWSTTIL